MFTKASPEIVVIILVIFIVNFIFTIKIAFLNYMFISWISLLIYKK